MASSSTSGAMRQTALRAGGACVRCRKGKTKCVYENGRAPCRNCAKGMHECYLPSESNAHIHGQTPARHGPAHRPARDSLPGAGSDSRVALPGSAPSRGASNNPDKITQDLVQECERIVSKSFPACVAFHKPSFIQQLKNSTLDVSIIYALLCLAARTSPNLIRRFGGNGGAAAAAEHFATRAFARVQEALDSPQLSDIQALCLLVIHEWGSKSAVRAYAYLGLAARLLQMHRIVSGNAQPDENPFLKEESFRRTLWLIYILDSFLTSTPGRNPALMPSDYAGVALPCNDMNFAFGNASFVETLDHQPPHGMPEGAQPGEVGEFGHIVLATSCWRDVVQMLVKSSAKALDEDSCAQLINEIDTLRSRLPLQYVEKANQIQLHITMGSGLTYAFLHCLLHCATIFVYRRRLLQSITSLDANAVESWRNSPHCHEIVDRLMSSCHSTISLLTALNAGADKDSLVPYPIFMLFAAFTSSSITAYMSMKGLTPPNSVETAANIVREGLTFMHSSLEAWPLIVMWYNHLSVMQRVLNNEMNIAAPAGSAQIGRTPSVKDEAGSNHEAADEMDTTGGGPNESVSGSVRDESEPPVPVRKLGFSAINGGGSAGVSTPATGTPPPAEGTPAPGPAPKTEAQHPAQQTDMTAIELCGTFERQLLGQDDLAAFMGGGV